MDVHPLWKLIGAAAAVLVIAVLVAVPRNVFAVSAAATLAGMWLYLVLGVALPDRAERAGAELSRRIAEFADAANALGDQPARSDLERVLHMPCALGLQEHEIAGPLGQVRASLAAVDLMELIHRGELPLVTPDDSLPVGEACHFAGAVRSGRRRSDVDGRLLLTTGALHFQGGALDVHLPWPAIAGIRRAGNDLIVSPASGRRQFRFTCQSPAEAATAGVIAEYLSCATPAGQPQLTTA